jgi:hypothetical protein
MIELKFPYLAWDSGDCSMIANNSDLEVTQQRIAYFQRLLEKIRSNATPGQFEPMASGYRLEIEKMQAEVMDYLLRPIAGEAEEQAAHT